MDALGTIYENGLGVPRDLQQAQQWYQKAADAGNQKAAESLARLRSGSSTKKN